MSFFFLKESYKFIIFYFDVLSNTCNSCVIESSQGHGVVNTGLEEYLLEFIRLVYAIFVSKAAHGPTSAHPSYFEAINHKIFNHLFRSIHKINILSSIDWELA